METTKRTPTVQEAQAQLDMIQRAIAPGCVSALPNSTRPCAWCAMPADMTTGMDLKVERVRRGLTLTQVARYMGLSRVTVTKYEKQESPRPEVVTAYREALLALRRAA